MYLIAIPLNINSKIVNIGDHGASYSIHMHYSIFKNSMKLKSSMQCSLTASSSRADYSSNGYNADVNSCTDSSRYTDPPGSVVCLFLSSLCFMFCILRHVLITKFDAVLSYMFL